MNLKVGEKNYHDLIRFVGNFGHGVFTANMLSTEELRIPLRMFVKRNPDFFLSFRGGPGSLNVYSLTKAGCHYFGLKGALTKSLTYESHIDMAVINAFLYQTEIAVNYSYGPHLRLSYQGKVFGLNSLKWGISKDLNELDGLIMRKGQFKNLQLLPREFLTAKFNVSTSHLEKVFSNSYFPFR